MPILTTTDDAEGESAEHECKCKDEAHFLWQTYRSHDRLIRRTPLAREDHWQGKSNDDQQDREDDKDLDPRECRAIVPAKEMMRSAAHAV